jgi:hypothetical protein
MSSSCYQVNIGGKVNDLFYRYKRNVIHTTLRNKQNGRLKLDNIDLIAQQLHVEKRLMIKYLQKHLNVQIHKDMIHSSQVTNQQIESGINLFIEQYVLCLQCRLPELNQENVCKSCGYVTKQLKSKTEDEEAAEMVEQQMSATLKADKKLDKKIAQLLQRLYHLHDKKVMNETDKTTLDDLIYALFECETEEIYITLQSQALNLLNKI